MVKLNQIWHRRLHWNVFDVNYWKNLTWISTWTILSQRQSFIFQFLKIFNHAGFSKRILFTTIKNRRNHILNWRIGLLDFERSLNSELAHKPFFAIVLSPSQGNKKKSVTETPEELETESNKSRICNLQIYKIKAT